MSKSGIDVYGYEFTDPDATIPVSIPVALGSLGGADPPWPYNVFSGIYKLTVV